MTLWHGAPQCLNPALDFVTTPVSQTYRLISGRLCLESTTELGEGNVFPMLLYNDRVSMIYAVFTTPR